GVGVVVADRAAVLGRQRGYVIGAVVQVDGASAQNLQAGSAEGRGLGHCESGRASCREGAGIAEGIVDGQVAERGQPDVGVVGDAAGGVGRGGVLGGVGGCVDC